MDELGNLSNCVMDSDSGATGRARRLRREAFVGSLILEAAVVGAMLLWPLLAPAVLPAQMAVTPVPPYQGAPIGDGPVGFGPGPDIPGGSRDGRPIELPSPTVTKGPLKVSAGVMAALLIHRVQPDYPAVAKAMGLSGTVELQARIGTDGTVQELEVVSGNPILARAAIEAVQQWRYQPTRLSGQPVEVETHITVTFSMH